MSYVLTDGDGFFHLLNVLLLILAKQPTISLPIKNISFTNLENGDVLVQFDHAYEDLTSILEFIFSIFMQSSPDNVLQLEKVGNNMIKTLSNHPFENMFGLSQYFSHIFAL